MKLDCAVKRGLLDLWATTLQVLKQMMITAKPAMEGFDSRWHSDKARSTWSGHLYTISPIVCMALAICSAA
jgi:hypothetical protein